MLDLKRLHLLRELSVLRTIAKVAETMGQTRPAISQQLAKLEEDVGVALFERSGRGIKLTMSGQRLVARSHELFNLVENIEAELDSEQIELRGEVRICAFGSAAHCLLPTVLRTLVQKHPKLDVFVTEQESLDGMRAVASKQADLSIVDDLVNVGTKAGLLDSQHLCRDTFVAVLPAQHRLAGNSTISLLDLATERWASSVASVPYCNLLVSACQEQGFTPRIRGRFRNMMTTIELVRSVDFVAVLPQFIVRDLKGSSDIVLIPITPTLGRNISVAFSRGSGARPAIAAVVAALKSSVRDLGLDVCDSQPKSEPCLE